MLADREAGSSPRRPTLDQNARSTIVAPATAQGRAGVAVIRASGPLAATTLERIAGSVPPARAARLRRFVDPRSGGSIDVGLALWFPAPASFTGEDVAEFHIHGGLAVTAAMLDALIAGCGCRMAEAGEFTRRAFDNGRLDLAEVEGLADLVDAETEAQRKQALRQLDGALGRRIEAWSGTLLELSAWAEAALDFSDEADVPARTLAEAIGRAGEVADDIERELAASAGAERLREGFTVAIAGRPNAGKSTLLNALARREVAIVSPMAGTTRDILEARLDIGGLPVTLIDMAGIRDSSDPIEAEGVRRARRRVDGADLVLWLSPADERGRQDENPPKTAIIVRSKSDLAPIADSATELQQEFVNLSAKTGEGLDKLISVIADRARRRLGEGGALVTRERQRQALEDAIRYLRSAIETHGRDGGDELVAEDIRLALRALGRVTGRVDVEDVLGAIFSRFCIGK